MIIGFTELEKWEKEYLKNRLKGHKLVFLDSKLGPRNISKLRDCDILVVFIYSEINRKVLDRLPKLKMIATTSTGFNHIDVEECRKRGITVCNVPSYGTDTVAEYTLGLMLALAHKIFDAVNKTRHNDFSLKDLMGFDLKGKRLGVIGPGRIGQRVIQLAKAFGMDVIAYSPRPKKDVADKLGFEYVPFVRLLKESDIITIHAPLTEETYHMINKKTVKMIKRGAYLVNTARGAIIDTDALMYALDKGILAGAALDVLEAETFVKEEKQLLHSRFIKEVDWKNVIRQHIILKKKNVIVTPHSAFYSREALKRILDTTIENINGFLGGRPVNTV